MRPGNWLTKTFDGNTAHSTGWWWSHAGAFYSGGSLYYGASDPTLLEYDAGRDQVRGGRSPCLVDKCVTANNCDAYCSEGEQGWFRLTNTKIFLSPSPGLNSVSCRHDRRSGFFAFLPQIRRSRRYVFHFCPSLANASGAEGWKSCTSKPTTSRWAWRP